MKLTLLALLALLLFPAGPVLALDPYLGATGQYGAVHEIISHPPGADVISDGRTFAGPGVQLEAGLIGDRALVYAGFRYDYASRFTEGDKWQSGGWEEWNTQEEWFAQHALLGTRVALARTTRPVKFVLGAGLTLGWAQMAVRNWERVGKTDTTETCWEGRIKNYNARLGWLAETGAVLTTLHPLDFWMLLRYDNLGMGQPRPSPYAAHIRNHMQLALALGASYTFRR